MRVVRSWFVLAAAFALACDQIPRDPVAPETERNPRAARSSSGIGNEPLGTVSGSGQYDIGGLLVSFSIDAALRQNEQGEGEFRIFVDEGDGLTVEVVGKVICLSFDPANGRAWIGARVKSNQSTDPGFRTKITRPGHDVWFRVLDQPDGDRSTFVGFEGAAGFITSEEYCAGQPWPADNARTWPVVSGGITIQP